MALDPDAIEVEGVAFRYSNYDTPFWARPNSRPGRWHVRGDPPTQYLALTPAGAWSQLIRYEGLRDEPAVAEVRMAMWAVRLGVGRIADLGDFETAQGAGVDPDALVDENWSRCQALGRELREAGFAGVLAPSAALPDSQNLTLFGPRYSVRFDVHPALASAIPAAVTAVGSPPHGLVASVRQRGQQHAGYRSYVVSRGSA